MKQQTFYISDDNFYFKDLNECVEYENEFYIKLKQAEEKYLGERLKHVYCEPCLDTIKHDKNKLLELVFIFNTFIQIFKIEIVIAYIKCLLFHFYSTSLSLKFCARISPKADAGKDEYAVSFTYNVI